MKIIFLCIFFLSQIGFSQSNILKGNVTESFTNKPLKNVLVNIENTNTETTTDALGNFKITTNQSFPIKLIFSGDGFETTSILITESKELSIKLNPIIILGNEVIIISNRVPTKIMESGVTIEKINSKSIQNSPNANYYDNIGKLKGVDLVTSSMLFQTPTTRGFSLSGNVRFNQIVAGMDNQSPGANHAFGNISGLTELDVESIELLPGASSAMYGSGGINGTLIVNAKNPFESKGLSILLKTGMNGIKNATLYQNYSFRWADKVSEKFAYKISLETINAKDWQATDYRNYQRKGNDGKIISGDRTSDPNYDGINVYGDETSGNIKLVLDGIGQAVPSLQPFINSLPSNIPVSRTGYTENELAKSKTDNFKLSTGIHYKITPKTEISFLGNYGVANSIYTGNVRYAFEDVKVGQYKIELTNKNWFLRSYTSQQHSGNAYDLTATAQLFNEAWKPSGTATGWYSTYGQAYLAQKLANKPDAEAHAIARSTADTGRPVAGSPEFENYLNQVKSQAIPNGGKIIDKCNLYVQEGMYHFVDLIKFVDVISGASFKRYNIKSEGTLYGDKDGPIKSDEIGAYTQISKKIFKDILHLSAAIRFDKKENFEGHFTPRFSALVKLNKDNNLRLSYQTGYRFPTNGEQFIDLSTANGNFIGGVKQIWDKYNLTSNPVYSSESVAAGTNEIVAFREIKPETVKSFEIGYKSLLNKNLLIDMYLYHSTFDNFLSRRNVLQKINPQGDFSSSNLTPFSIMINTDTVLKSYGFGIEMSYLLPNNFTISGNISSDALYDVPDNLVTNFNAPKYRTNISIANSGIDSKKRWSFATSWHWQESFLYESQFVNGILPAYHNIDAQISYKINKSKIKLGATNLLNYYYRNGLGNSNIGGTYYISYIIDVL